jgi:signal recognition particle receptor subunit beta
MAAINPATRELTAKVVYYGPALCGKTTNLHAIHGQLPVHARGKLLSLSTKTDRTIFFDFLPLGLGSMRGMKIRVQLYTVPGQVYYNETRKLVLKGADGIVFVADSQEEMIESNQDSLGNLEDNLAANGAELRTTPHVLQFNKQDLDPLIRIDLLNAHLNRYKAPFHTSVATRGIGVEETLKSIVRGVLENLSAKYSLDLRLVM